MKKFLIAATLSLLMLGSQPSYAADCQYGTMSDAIVSAVDSAGDNVNATAIPDSQVKILLEKKGPPPNADADKPLEFVRIDAPSVGLTILLVGQDGCRINQIGPIDTTVIDNVLGVTNASGQ